MGIFLKIAPTYIGIGSFGQIGSIGIINNDLKCTWEILSVHESDKGDNLRM
jgi:hypothetical protein